MEDNSQDINQQYTQVLKNYKTFIQSNYFAHELAVKFSKPLKVRAKTPKEPRGRRNEYFEPMYYIGKPIEFMPYPIHSRRNTESPSMKVKPDKKPKQTFINPFNPHQKLNIQKCIESPNLNIKRMSPRQKSSGNSVRYFRPSSVVKTRNFSVSMNMPASFHIDALRKSNMSVITNPESVASLTILNPKYKPNKEPYRDSVTIKIPTVPISYGKSKRGTEESTFSAEKTHSRVGSKRPSLTELNSIEVQRRKKYPWSRYYEKKEIFSE